MYSANTGNRNVRVFSPACRPSSRSPKKLSLPARRPRSNSVFVRLGLTDCALLEVANADTPVVTVDFDLYHTALTTAPDSAINFNHLRLL